MADPVPTTHDAALRRRRVVVLNADIADYSRHMADDAAATVETMRVYHDVVARLVDDAGGDLVNFVGDSFVATFDDARTALRTAIGICHAVRDHNRRLPRSRRMWFRQGLDAGEIFVAGDGRHFGDPLNVAARIQELSDTGGINVSGTVFAELDEPGLRLVSLGPRRLKNIPELVRVYRLTGLDAGDGAAPPPARHLRRPSVAVLPTMAADEPVTRDIAHGLRLELLTALTRMPGLQVMDVAVAAEGGVGAAAGAAQPPGRDGAGAAYILVSGLARAGERLRAYAELVETVTMNRVWAERWEGTTADPFALHDAFTAGTLRALDIELVLGEPARIYHAALDDVTMRTVYLAWHHFQEGNRHAWRRATELFAAVAAARPDAAVGPSLAAFARWWGVTQGLSDTPRADLDAALADARRGLAIGDDTGLSQTVIAAVQLHEGGDLDTALATARHALALRPTCDVTFAVEGSLLCYLGAWQEAVEASRRAIELSPRPVTWYRNVLACAYYAGERYGDAADVSGQLVELDADNDETLLVLAAALQAQGLTRRARATVETLIERFPGVSREVLRHRHPFRDPAVLDRWNEHLAAAGLP